MGSEGEAKRRVRGLETIQEQLTQMFDFIDILNKYLRCFTDAAQRFFVGVGVGVD